MIIFLPNEIDGLPKLEHALTGLDIKAVLNKIKREKVEVTLPKFKLEKFVDLSEALQKVSFVIRELNRRIMGPFYFLIFYN